MKRCLRGILLISMVVYVLMGYRLPVSGQEEKTIRVGYFDCGDFYQMDKNQNIIGYEACYLDKISEYTGIKFEYVDCDSWDQAMTMLENHEIDLLGTMQYTDERAKNYEYCKLSYGITYAALVTLDYQPYVYEDYEAMQNKKIGVTQNYVRKNEFLQLIKDKQIQADIIYYATQEELFAALNSGQIDIAATNSHTMEKNWKIIEKYCYSPFFFASWKENTSLIQEIDNALVQIKLYESNFQNRLQQQYFKYVQDAPFTSEELAYIAKYPHYTVYFESNSYPMAYYDQKEQRMKGICIDLCEMLSKECGLEFDYKPLNGKKDFKENEITFDMIYYSMDGVISPRDEHHSSSFLDGTYQFYQNKEADVSFDHEKNYRVAIPKNRIKSRQYIEKNFPNFVIVEYESPESCMKAIKKKEIDFTFLNSYVADHYLKLNDMTEIMPVPASGTSAGIVLRTSEDTPSIMVSILNKAIGKLDENECTAIVQHYALNTVPKVNIEYLIRNHLAVVLLIMIIVFFLILIATISQVRNRILKQQQILLANTNNKLTELSNAKSDFFSRMSHDMRTPLHAVLGFAELARETTVESEKNDYLKKIQDSGNLLLGLINDTLNMSKLETGKFVLEPQVINGTDLIEKMEQIITPSAKQKNIHLSIHKPKEQERFIIYADPLRLQQVFLNIASNAVKFTPENGHIDVMIEVTEETEDVFFTKISIKDDGIGMSQDFQQHIFDAYSQENPQKNHNTSGTGLGMAITYKLITLMGGTIAVQSELGTGSTFLVTLALEKAKQRQLMEEEKLDPDLERLKGISVLLCEDHPLNIELATRLLEKKGMQVTSANNGKCAVDIFAQSKVGEFQVILMDICMPVMDGIEATKRIRQMDREDAKRIPIIAMSANAFEENRSEGQESGMDAYLSKPMNPSQMYETILDIVSKRKIH